MACGNGLCNPAVAIVSGSSWRIARVRNVLELDCIYDRTAVTSTVFSTGPATSLRPSLVRARIIGRRHVGGSTSDVTSSGGGRRPSVTFFHRVVDYVHTELPPRRHANGNGERLVLPCLGGGRSGRSPVFTISLLEPADVCSSVSMAV